MSALLSIRAPSFRSDAFDTLLAVDKIASRASIPPTYPPTSAQREVRGCPPPGTSPCPYACVSVHVPYLGMTLDFTVPGTVKFTMTDYIKGMLEVLPADMDGEAATPAANHLFEVSPKPMLLDESKADMFHHNVAKLLFLCKQARPDIQTAVAFLCT
jgi:hypothetical protein